MPSPSGNRATPFRVDDVLKWPVAASTFIDAGVLIMLDADGLAAEADPEGNAGSYVLGVSAFAADNSAGAAGAVYAQLRQGIFSFDSDVSWTDDDRGTTVYALDDRTITNSSGAGTTPIVAGVLVDYDSDQCWVRIDVASNAALSSGAAPASSWGDVTVVAGEDLTGAQYHIVQLLNDVNLDATVALPVDSIDDDGITTIGVLQNAPDVGENATVRVAGKTSVKYGASISGSQKLTVCGSSSGAGKYGRARVAAEGHYVLGQSLLAGVNGDLGQMIITHEGVQPV